MSHLCRGICIILLIGFLVLCCANIYDKNQVREPYVNNKCPYTRLQKAYIRPETNTHLFHSEYDRTAADGNKLFTYEVCRQKCESLDKCAGFVKLDDHNCVLYDNEQVSLHPTNGAIGTSIQFEACSDTPPVQYRHQGDGIDSIQCTSNSPNAHSDCQFLGSAGCAEGKCMMPFVSDKKVSCTKAWENLLDRFPDIVDSDYDAYMSRDAFLQSSCGSSVKDNQARHTNADNTHGTNAPCTPVPGATERCGLTPPTNDQNLNCSNCVEAQFLPCITHQCCKLGYTGTAAHNPNCTKGNYNQCGCDGWPGLTKK